MLKLIPMLETEFEPFMQISMKDQAEGQVIAGEWQAEEAEEKMRQLRAQFLPAGLETPDHFFYTLESGETAQKVGSLWFTVMEQEGQRMIFVLDIQIDPAHRRHGYGSQAFLQMESIAREMGITTIALHVFMHNQPARAMYEKLGYQGAGTMMAKELS